MNAELKRSKTEWWRWRQEQMDRAIAIIGFKPELDTACHKPGFGHFPESPGGGDHPRGKRLAHSEADFGGNTTRPGGWRSPQLLREYLSTGEPSWAGAIFGK